MLKINRLKKIKSNFPVLVGDKVVENNTCNLLIDEISKSKAFDDMSSKALDLLISSINKLHVLFSTTLSPTSTGKLLLIFFNRFILSINYTYLL